MLGEMSHTFFGSKVKRIFFDNILTKYILSLDVPKYPGYDEVEDAPKGLLDIMELLNTTTKVSKATRNEREENFNR